MTSTTRPAIGGAWNCCAARTGPPPSSLGNDLQALGLYEAARELGLRIPEDLSVVGFDDLPVAPWVGPPLTTVRQPLTEMAEAAAKLVLDLGRAEGTCGRHQGRAGDQPGGAGEYGGSAELVVFPR